MTLPATPAAPATLPPLRDWPRAVARFALLWLAVALAVFVHWLHANFGDVLLGQIVFHWRFLGGSSSIAPVIATDCLVVCGLGSLFVATLLAWAWKRVGRPWMKRRVVPARQGLVRRFGTWAPVAVAAVSLVTLASRTSAVQFLRPVGTDDYFAAHYVRPEGVALQPGQRKNLLLVYVESLEASYTQPAVWGSDLLARLTALQPVSFADYQPMPGTGWTIAAIVSTQCGVPLEPVGFLDSHSQGEFAKEFLPGADCLGDILHRQGYRSVFMGGASLAFSGKGKFFAGHHYDESFGREEWLQHGIPRSHLSGWGLHDDDLFAQAKLKLRQLHDAGRPFNLTLLTVDTHWPSGYLSPGCRQRGAAELEGIVTCTSEQVADLVQFVRDAGYDADTQVVVVGDHLTPPNTLSDKLAQVPKRSIYNAFFAHSLPPQNRADIVPFDVLPTLLDTIGLHPAGGRLGLGTSAFGTLPGTAAPTAATRAELADNVLSPSRTYIGLWEPAKPRRDMAVAGASATR